MRTCAAMVWFLLLAWLPAQPQTGPQSVSAKQTKQQQNVPAKTPSAAPSAIDPAKEADIRRLLELTGAKGLVKQTMDSMEGSIKPLLASALPPGEYRDKLIDLFFAKFQSKANPKALLDLAVPLYDKYLSHEEIKGLIQFYQTPLGQKTITVLPKLTGEMAELGKQWGQDLGQQCMREVLAEHPDLAQALEAAGKAQP